MVIHAVQYECVRRKRETLFPLSLASNPASTSKRQVAKALRKPTQLLSNVPTQTHTHTQKVGTHFYTTDFDVTNTEHIFPSYTRTHTRAWGFILYTEISELIASSSWAYPHTYTEIMVLDALMLATHEYALDSDVQHVQRITSDKHSCSLSLSPSLALLNTHRKGHNSSHPHTDTHI